MMFKRLKKIIGREKKSEQPVEPVNKIEYFDRQKCVRKAWERHRKEFCFPDDIVFDERAFLDNLEYILEYFRGYYGVFNPIIGCGFEIISVSFDRTDQRCYAGDAKEEYWKIFFKPPTMDTRVVEVKYRLKGKKVMAFKEHLAGSLLHVSYFCQYLVDSHKAVREEMNRLERESYEDFTQRLSCSVKQGEE